jgi:hypothetical protein
MRWSLACLTLVLACTPPEKVPSTDGLYGYWRPADGEQTVFAFAPPTDAEELFNLSGNMLAPQTKPVSAVYVNDSLVQLATFEATATELKQTVLADMGNPPGAAFSTRIYEFDRGVKLRSLRVRERAAGETAFTETTLTTLTNLEDLLLLDHGKERLPLGDEVE